MRLFGRNDTSLAAALIVGIFMLFHEPLQFLVETAGDIERQYHLDLIQPLIVLGAVFAFHQYRKRQEAKADLASAAADVTQARLRSQELERLVGLSRSLAMATDFTRLHQTFSRYLPKFTHDRSCWLLICHQGCWDVLVRAEDDHRPTEELESIAERALIAGAGANRTSFDGVTCFPMMVGGRPVGMVMVDESPGLVEEDCRSLEAAAALSAISVRNIQTLIETRGNSLRDGLTGCFNRAHALDTLKGELRRAQRADAPLSTIMFDVDKFKQVNDTYGHLAGDHLLAEVGKRLGEVLRTSDVKCRYGGDEFLLILPDTPAAGARQLAESIRQEMSRTVLQAGEHDVNVTISVGVATAERAERDAQAFIARVDRALYRAKQAGRNRVHADVVETVAPLRLVGAAV
jgi:diguanylate cyclase (GGDEF)-like protein